MSVEEEIAALIKEGRTEREIASILGMNRVVINRYIQQMDIRPPATSRALPYGITTNTITVRMQLGLILNDMVSSGLSSREIARITGLNTREQRAASRRPYSHDWKLSQIERTCGHANKNIKDIV